MILLQELLAKDQSASLYCLVHHPDHRQKLKAHSIEFGRSVVRSALLRFSNALRRSQEKAADDQLSPTDALHLMAAAGARGLSSEEDVQRAAGAFIGRSVLHTHNGNYICTLRESPLSHTHTHSSLSF
jgi:hypothetical protein